MSAALTLDGVCRNFGGLRAVDGVSMRASPEQITGLIGPNGAGKTTLINLVTGVLRLSGGRILFDGKDISEASAAAVARAGIARTFQSIRLLPECTVLQNVMIGMHRHRDAGVLAELFGLPAAIREDAALQRRALVLLERLDLQPFAHYPAGSLSYGHQRRTEICRALALEPRLLLLDEPVAGMNDVEAASLGSIFRRLAREGLGIVLVEHNMRFVMSLCDELYVLDSGRLLASGRPSEVITRADVIEAYLGSDIEATPC